MASSSALRSGIKNYARYLNVLSGTEPYVAPPVSSYDLLETEILTGTQASVTFSSLNSTYGSTYQHLQVRMVMRATPTGSGDTQVRINLNSDTGTNYAFHKLRGDGTSVTSSAGTSTDYIKVGWTPEGSATADVFSAIVLDLLDPFETTKYSTVRSLSGSTNERGISLHSGLWMNTAAVDSIQIIAAARSLVEFSRFSLYGLKAA